ncbi:hypothetical protein [Achromobacter xylosoxidans]|uniref:hypothetical protein n=1 Tax=Alcaligenes xylosoxydans xylosoxydans TaxID=85698 RepID=UPI000B4949C3|nr:hypothetical protein [Achromobacter xylosoxidans]
MTDHTTAAQAALHETVLTDLEVQETLGAVFVASHPYGRRDVLSQWEWEKAAARAIEQAVLSKLRAPVADERALENVADAAIKAAYVAAHGDASGWLGRDGSYFISGYSAGSKAAPLASAPVADERAIPDIDWQLLRDTANLVRDRFSAALDIAYANSDASRAAKRRANETHGALMAMLDAVLASPAVADERAAELLEEARGEGHSSVAAYVDQLKTSATVYMAERNSARDAVSRYRQELIAPAARKTSIIWKHTHRATGQVTLSTEAMPALPFNREKWESTPHYAGIASAPVAGEPVGKVVLFGGDLKEVSWTAGKMPPPGTTLYAAPQASEAVRDPGMTALGSVALPPLPPIPHYWAPTISGSITRALQDWANEHASVAVLADREQRGGDTDPIPMSRKVMITPADANLRHIGYVFGKPIFSRVNEPGAALSSQPEQP